MSWSRESIDSDLCVLSTTTVPYYNDETLASVPMAASVMVLEAQTLALTNIVN